MTRAAVLTISDGAHAGRREDLSGPVAIAMLKERLAIEQVHAEIAGSGSHFVDSVLLQILLILIGAGGRNDSVPYPGNVSALRLRGGAGSEDEGAKQ